MALIRSLFAKISMVAIPLNMPLGMEVIGVKMNQQLFQILIIQTILIIIFLYKMTAKL